MDKESILDKLSSSKSADRKKAAKEIGKQKITAFGAALFNAFCNEKHSRTWETKVEMIISLGLVDYKSALNDIEVIVQKNNPHDMITHAAAQTYVRLNRSSTHDAQPVIELLGFGGLSVVGGALVVLGHDQMMPPNNEIVELLELGWDLHRHKDRIGYEFGYLDPRYGLALACSRWDKELTGPFLEHCHATCAKDPRLKRLLDGLT